MRRLTKGFLSLLGFAALLTVSVPASASCVGASCTCSVIAVPAWTPLPGTTATYGAYAPPTAAPPWYTPAPPAVTPSSFVSSCVTNISSCVSASVVLQSDPPPSGISSWASFSSLIPPSGYRTSGGCFGYGTGPCNATVSAPSSPNAQPGITNYNYSTAFPCQMTQAGSPVAGSDAGAVKQFRMRKGESMSFSFTVPPMGSIMPQTTDASGNLIPPIYRSISFADWNNPFSVAPTKFVTISKQSGDFNSVKAAANDPCYQSGVMGDMKYSIIDPTLNGMSAFYLPPDVCPLEAGQTYYINVRFEDPKSNLMTQGTSVTDGSAAVATAAANLKTAQDNLAAALMIPPSDPGVVSAQAALNTAIDNNAAVASAQANLNTAVASGNAAAIASAQSALNSAQASYDAAVNTALANLAAATAAAPPTGPVTVTTATINALNNAVTAATNAYTAAVAANQASQTASHAFIQDTCEWSQCKSDQARSNVGTPMEDSYANAYPKEWQCSHDMQAYYTLPGVQSFCQMVANGEGPIGCTHSYDSDGNPYTDCFPYVPVDPNTCIGNRTVTGSTTDPYTGVVTYTYGYTGGTPLPDCGVSIDMGCGLAAP